MTANRIERTTTIEGIVTPAFIHNAGWYFLIDLPVYADGLVDVWETVDLALFEEKIASGWVSTAAPDGASVEISALASFAVDAGRWELTPRELSTRVRALVEELNPRMRNLYECHEENIVLIGKKRVSTLGISKKVPIRPESSTLGARRLRGESTSAFFVDDGRTYVADLRVFEDGMIELGRVPSARVVSIDELHAAARDGTLRTEPRDGERVEILGLGSFAVRRPIRCIALEELLRSMPDLVDRACGRPDSVARCRAAYERYLREPTEANREELRAAYERVPDHNRKYVGDMDTKDVAVRMILYGRQEIERWSHRALARYLGDPLPEIGVPEPRPALRYVDSMRIDLTDVRDSSGVHDAFAQALGFPSSYGRNMDAWIECMSSIDDPAAGMTAVHVEPGKVLVIELTGVRAFAARCPDVHLALLEAAAFVNHRRRERGEPAVLALSFAH